MNPTPARSAMNANVYAPGDELRATRAADPPAAQAMARADGAAADRTRASPLPLRKADFDLVWRRRAGAIAAAARPNASTPISDARNAALASPAPVEGSAYMSS